MKRNWLLALAISLIACLAQPTPLPCQDDSGKPPPKEDGSVYRVGVGVKAPRLIYSVDPEYDKASRKAKLQGTAVLALTVGTDGLPSDIRVARSLSPALDRKAIEAVSRWKFAPATKDGKPVAVKVNVEVAFRLY